MADSLFDNLINQLLIYLIINTILGWENGVWFVNQSRITESFSALIFYKYKILNKEFKFCY